MPVHTFHNLSCLIMVAIRLRNDLIPLANLHPYHSISAENLELLELQIRDDFVDFWSALADLRPVQPTPEEVG